MHPWFCCIQALNDTKPAHNWPKPSILVADFNDCDMFLKQLTFYEKGLRGHVNRTLFVKICKTHVLQVFRYQLGFCEYSACSQGYAFNKVGRPFEQQYPKPSGDLENFQYVKFRVQVWEIFYCRTKTQLYSVRLVRTRADPVFWSATPCCPTSILCSRGHMPTAAWWLDHSSSSENNSSCGFQYLCLTLSLP